MWNAQIKGEKGSWDDGKIVTSCKFISIHLVLESTKSTAVQQNERPNCFILIFGWVSQLQVKAIIRKSSVKWASTGECQNIQYCFRKLDTRVGSISLRRVLVRWKSVKCRLEGMSYAGHYSPRSSCFLTIITTEKAVSMKRSRSREKFKRGRWVMRSSLESATELVMR